MYRARKLLAFMVLLLMLLPTACSKSGYTAPVVKPKYHKGWFDQKKNKRAKRTKIVKMKS